MRLERVTNIRQLKTGDSVVCLIGGDRIPDAKVFVGIGVDDKEERYFYICQNEYRGRNCGKDNLLGYSYSWAVKNDPATDSFTRDCAYDSVTGFRKVVKGES